MRVCNKMRATLPRFFSATGLLSLLWPEVVISLALSKSRGATRAETAFIVKLHMPRYYDRHQLAPQPFLPNPIIK